MRKLATAAAVSLALASSGAFGLGLGEIEMQSALNQRLEAEIQLTSVEPGELEGMIVQLASPEAFARAGIERSSVLTDLRFSVDQNAGNPVIKVESTSPVVEPFLNFLVEVDWPQGRMVREYTVLLDPPVFVSPSASQRNATADQPAVTQNGGAGQAVPVPIERNNDAGVEVDLSDLEDESTENILSLDEATSNSLLTDDSDLVSLDEVTDESLLLGGSGVSSGVDGDVVSLSDLGAPNTAADAQREADALDTFSFDDIQVQTPRVAEEVTDDLVFGANEPTDIGEVGSDDPTVVSLDDIEEPAQPLASPGAGGSQVTVGAGDTLFEIARDNAPAGVSVQQMMMAMLAANESGFINNNINLVRTGAILRVPDADEANKLTQAQAVAAISDQTQLWQDYRDSLRSTASTQVARNIVPEAQDSAAGDQAAGDTSLPDSGDALAGLSDEARAILDSAREEVLNREELRIVADNATAEATASATADETADTDDKARIGEVNRELQLAREELSATRVSAEDLNEQATELTDTTDKLDAMVSLRQNEVARLEAQLEEARNAAEQNAQISAADAADSEAVELDSADTGAAGEEVADVAADQLAAVAEQATDSANDAATDAADNVQGAAGEMAANTGDAIDEAADSGTTALTDAGETLGEVELFSEGEDSAAIADSADASGAETENADAASTAAPQAWYQEFLQDPKRLAIAGLGALGLLGVIGTLLFRRKRSESREEWTLDDMDEAEFNNSDTATAPQSTTAGETVRLDDASGAIAAAGLAGGAAVAGTSLANNNDDSDDDDLNDSTLAFPVEEASGMSTADDSSDEEDDLDKDDTISEVDVYLAYGLHGQAEELLTKAIERKPENAEYALKLLQTYHAQGNSVAFHETAASFHTRFGGDENPAWADVARMGLELQPNDPLYATSHADITKVRSEELDSTLDASDFLPASDTDSSGSISRNFGSSETTVDLVDGGDQSSFMDESLDPAFAFDETDLEATGDFTAISEELSAEESKSGLDAGGGIDFTTIDESGVAVVADDSVQDFDADLDAVSLDESLSLEELNDMTESVDDLTLDLDQLSGDLELDSAELLNSDLSDLDIPELATDNELLLDSSAALDNSADEMDTMMDLAKAYIDMGEKDSASNALDEIIKSGSPEQVTEAENLLRKIS